MIFSSKWILIIFYSGLVIAQAFYCVKFCQEIWHLLHDFWHVTENEFMLMVLTLIDITMIANLIKMIITGSYQSFIERVDTRGVSNISSGLMKVKMGASLIGVSSIHLLQVFLNPNNSTTREIYSKCGIHALFLLSTIGLAIIYNLSVKTEISETQHEKTDSTYSSSNAH